MSYFNLFLLILLLFFNFYIFFIIISIFLTLFFSDSLGGFQIENPCSQVQILLLVHIFLCNSSECMRIDAFLMGPLFHGSSETGQCFPESSPGPKVLVDVKGKVRFQLHCTDLVDSGSLSWHATSGGNQPSMNESGRMSLLLLNYFSLDNGLPII